MCFFIRFNLRELTLRDLHIDGSAFDGVIFHHANYMFCILVRNIYKGEVVKNINASDAFAC